MGGNRVCESGHALEERARFCPECGARAPEGPQPQLELLDYEVADAVPSDAGSDSPVNAGEVQDDRLGVRHRRRGIRPKVVLIAVAVLLLTSSLTWFLAFRTTREDRYLSALAQAGLLRGFGTTDSAVAQGKAFCAKLAAGQRAQGYESQKLAVESFCPEYLTGFKVVPTPEELQAELTKALRRHGLGGRFASDAAAVAHAKKVCRSLNDGGSQQGPAEDAVAVSVYCRKYTAGFTTLYPIKVHGTFTLSDSDPSSYFPSISGSHSYCSGDGGYSDIGPGTEVVVKDSSGRVLTTTYLGRGRGLPPFECKFRFSFSVMDGRTGGYSVTVSDRGDLHYTAAQLKIPGEVAITLGS